jgi:hypothetical protein
MKKIFMIVAVAGFGLASCKKDYTCECTYTGAVSGSSSVTITDTKKDAEAACDEGDSSANGQTADCEIK